MQLVSSGFGLAPSIEAKATAGFKLNALFLTFACGLGLKAFIRLPIFVWG
jgi:hypothetical protein